MFQVGFVDPTGLARQSGLEEKAPAMSAICGSGSWWITEINHQPLNLFYKDDEVCFHYRRQHCYLLGLVTINSILIINF